MNANKSVYVLLAIVYSVPMSSPETKQHQNLLNMVYSAVPVSGDGFLVRIERSGFPGIYLSKSISFQ